MNTTKKKKWLNETTEKKTKNTKMKRKRRQKMEKIMERELKNETKFFFFEKMNRRRDIQK